MGLSARDAARRTTETMGALLWRRVYEARRDLADEVSLLPSTLESLLRDAGVAEPEDKAI